MVFHVGDIVIHRAHGLGEVVRIEERNIHDNPTNCYVVRTPELTIWIPIADMKQHSLRLPTSPEEFDSLISTLTNPSEKLPEDRVQRNDQLMAQMNDGKLASICGVVRDLTNYQRSTKLNDREKSILEQAKKSLLAEWTLSLDIPIGQAQQAMTDMLGG